MKPYQYQWMPKLVINDSFDYGSDLVLAQIVDDPDVLRKCAGSQVVSEWGDFAPIKGHSIVHLIANGATEYTGPNRNGDGFKSAFCKESHPTFKKYGALFRSHNNKNWDKRDGDILATAYNDEMGRNELAVAANHEKCGDWLSRLERGDKIAFSMGFDCHHDECAICGNKSPTRKFYCEHVKKNASYPYGMNRILPDGRKCFVDNPLGVWNDISYVGTGADMIAQDLRKIAGLDEFETIGGAELAEQLINDQTYSTVKMAIAQKLSRMEKQVPALSFKERSTVRMTQKVAEVLRSAPPSHMFKQLADLNVVLGFRDFFKLALGDNYTEDFANVVDMMEPYIGGCFSGITESPDRLEKVCRNSSYNPGKTAALRLNDYDRAELYYNFSLSPEVAQQRLLNQAINGTDISERKIAVDMNDPRISGLLDEYAAYKLAALEGCSLELTDEIIMTSVMSS